MTLGEYILTHAPNGADLARKVGVSQAAISRYANRKRVPRPDVMRRIAEVTGGAVTPNDFISEAK